MIEFYNTQAAGLAQDFIDEVDSTVQRIADFPRAGAAYHHGTRRLLLRRFPFAVVYRTKADVAEVVAIAHQRRRPDYWA